MPKDNIERLIKRGTVDIIQREDLEEKLRSEKKLRIKFGIDPTGSDLHLGHLVPLRKLAEFQKLGHHIVLLFGTFTGKIGDPTGKDKMRQPLTNAEIDENMKTYLNQASCVLDIKNIEIVKNGDWLGKMTFSEILELAGSFTVSQMIQRDMFQTRLEKGMDINLVEFFYPLMQGYDSVAIEADVEIGGTDQLFNLLAGRQIQDRYGKKPQSILTVPILEGTSGKEKMSKSLNNFIGVTESPRDIFGKLMSIPDHLMSKYFELLTDFTHQEIWEFLNMHPRDAKLRLAKEITTTLHNAEEAEHAEEEFLRMFSEKGLPTEVSEKILPSGTFTILEIVVASGLCNSNGEARRLISQGGVKWNEEKIENIEAEIEVTPESKILQVGKRQFLKIKGK
ncbi:tyrosine--tRNA ligase [Candidatus Peregrinibacteria bacterium]|nr:MAG: tyrosine--tRNA ligase [Candidatus Peregrinibacteria bacterium]